MIEKCKSATDKGDSFRAPAPLTDLSKAFDWLEQWLLLDKTTEPSFEHLGFEIKVINNHVYQEFWVLSQPNFDMSAREKRPQKFDQLLLKITTVWLSKHCYYNIKDFKIDILSRYEMKNIIENQREMVLL